MLKSRSTLFSKGIVLLGIPLLFELIIVCTLIFLQNQYELTTRNLSRSKQAVFVAGELTRASFAYLTNRVGESMNFTFMNDWQERRQELVSYERKLHSLLSTQESPERTSLLDDEKSTKIASTGEIDSEIDAIVKLCNRIQLPIYPNFPQFGRAHDSNEAEQSVDERLELMSQGLKKCADLGDKLRHIRQAEIISAEQSIKHMARTKQMIGWTIGSAIAGTILLAALLLWYFMNSIYKGFHNLTTNMQRFQNGQELQPLTGGSDEIALLDRMFHEMSDELERGRRIKQTYTTLLGRNLEQPLLATSNFLSGLTNEKQNETSQLESEPAQTNLPKKVTDGAIKAQKNLKRLLKLIDELLHVGERKSVGLAEINLAPADLAEIVSRSIEAVSELASKQKITIDFKESSVPLILDADRLVQVLVNLLSNAIKFSPANSNIEITVQKSDENQWIDVRITDHGRGIAASKCDTVFERFSQVESTDATEKGGTGLGLPICKEIVEMHGGKIGVESKEGEGSTFWIKLPQNSKNSLTNKEAPSAETATQTNTPAAENEKLQLQAAQKKARRAEPKLYVKGIVLVVVPLLFGLLITLSVLVLQQHYEKQVQSESRAQEIIFHANNLYTQCIETLEERIASRVFSNDAEYWRARDKGDIDIAQEYSRLKTLIGSGPEMNHLKEIYLCTRAVLLVSGTFESNSEEGLQKVQIFQRNFLRLKKAQPYLDRLSWAFKRFRTQEQFKSGDAVEEMTDLNNQINAVLFAAMAINALLAVLLFNYFMRSIYFGIKTLMENTTRFKQGQPLGAEIGGSDEISQVDSAFHKMALDITASAKMKQEVIAMVSHDLRTPLSAVTGYLSLLGLSSYAQIPQSTIREAEFHEKRLFQVIKLINELLDLEKIEANRLEIDPRFIYAETAVESAISEIENEAKEKRISIEDFESDLEIYADPHRLGQLLSNLLAASIELAKEGSSISLWASESEGRTIIRITIPDASVPSNIGNANIGNANYGDTLFMRYKATEDANPALPLAAELIRLHGGTIQFQTAETGIQDTKKTEASFWFTLPIGAQNGASVVDMTQKDQAIREIR